MGDSLSQASPPPPAPPTMASLYRKAKSVGKRVIGQPEEEVPVVSVQDWVNRLDIRPRRDVRGPSRGASTASYLSVIGRALCGKRLPNFWLDFPIQ